MAHKTFISYKYDEAQDLRDRIIQAMGDDASYYQGETSSSPDLSDTSTENIKCVLRDMLYDTSVTIVIISPNMTKSLWIDWEIEYSLKRITRKGRTSQTNGVVGVIMKYNGGYNWLETSIPHSDGHTTTQHDSSKMYRIINENRFNQDPMQYACEHCRSVSALNGSYISLIKEEDFLKNPNKYIDNAYEKSQNDADGYILRRKR